MLPFVLMHALDLDVEQSFRIHCDSGASPG